MNQILSGAEIGVGFVVVVREIVEYFDRNGTLVELVRELSKDRPGRIDLLSLLVPTSGPKAGPSPTGVLSNPVDVDPQVEVDFYFVVEPDRRTVSSRRKTESIYVRIPAVAATTLRRQPSQSALALAFDRSGSMQGYKMDVARAAADYIIDAAGATKSHLGVVAFDSRVETVLPLQTVSDPMAHKQAVRRVAPRGQTDLFAAWEECARVLRSAPPKADKRVVLITDGLLNQGMVDPSRFESEVARSWSRDGIATTCVSMGSDWNVDLLNRLASNGGGSIHFIDTVQQAQQALHEAFHTSSGVVAANLRAVLTSLRAATITQVNGAPTTLGPGRSGNYALSTQLRKNVEEEMVVRVEFPPPKSGQALDVLRCQIVYESPIDGSRRLSPEKTLRVHGEEDSPAKSVPVNQGVVCAAHSALSRECFRQALGAYLRDDREQATQLLSQARFALESGPKPPSGYRIAVGIQEERLRDIERFEGRVPAEYIKEKYIDELSHRDVVWNALCQMIDQFVSMAAESRRGSSEFETFRWADSMVNEFRHSLPLHGEEPREFGDSHDARMTFKDSDARSEDYWLRRAEITRSSREENDVDRPFERKLNSRQLRKAVVAGACHGFERLRQGTRDQLSELMARYLAIRGEAPRG